MKRIMDWSIVENVLNKDFYFKRSYKTIVNSIFIRSIINNQKIDTDEFIKLFVGYCRYDIVFPVLNKYFWIK
jgi:hypothetical protein